LHLFDTHAHYDSGAFHADRMELLSSMPAQGVELILNPGCDLESSQEAVKLAQTFPFVYAAVGVHPSDCETYSDQVEQTLWELAAHPKVRAIGEIGLDYYWKDNAPAQEQKAVFSRQMTMARDLKLPVIIHDRNAHQDCLEMVRQHPDVTGVYHCYSGDVEDAKTLVKLGWMISFTGVITYKNARKSLEVIQMLPMEHIMRETDAPYLTPEPFRGQRNHSGYLRYMAQTIARVKGLDEDEVAQITFENGIRFFGI
jgi:TatD DNase family protein